MYDVVIIGAGPAGLLAGIAAAQQGAKTLILDHMKEAGRKLLITGKGRCNITNICDVAEIIKNIPGNGVFLNSALRAFDNRQLIAFFEENDLFTKVERGGRVFPVSDKAADVRDTLLAVFKRLGGKIILNTKAKEILVNNGTVSGVKTNKDTFLAKSVVLAAGGASYPGTGSDGSGFLLAEKCGHSIIPLKPSLVPLQSNSPYLPKLQGLSLRNINAGIIAGGKTVKNEFGEMLFTHFGLSGPVILSLSNEVSKQLAAGLKVEIAIDLKPALKPEILDARIQRDFTRYSRKQIKNSLHELLPASLIPVVLAEAQIDEEKFTNQISKEERKRFLAVLKDFRLSVTSTRPLAEAIVTAGGVNLKEIDPKTLASKILTGLYFAGEVMDIDGYTGGFNLQAAFSTGYVAGTNAGSIYN